MSFHYFDLIIGACGRQTLMLTPVPTNTAIPQKPNKSHLHHIAAMDCYEAAEQSEGYICIHLQEVNIPVQFCLAQTDGIKR